MQENGKVLFYMESFDSSRSTTRFSTATTPAMLIECWCATETQSIQATSTSLDCSLQTQSLVRPSTAALSPCAQSQCSILSTQTFSTPIARRNTGFGSRGSNRESSTSR